MKLPNLRIGTRLLVLNLMIALAFIAIITVVISSYAIVSNMLTDVAHRDMDKMISNSLTVRQYSQLFSDINILSHTFYGRDEYLMKERHRLTNSVRSIMEKAEDPDVKSSILELSAHLTRFLKQCLSINNILKKRVNIDLKIHIELSKLKDKIGKLLQAGTLAGKDTIFMKQAQSLIIGYKESLLKTGKYFAEIGYGQYQLSPETTFSPVLKELESLILRLQTVTASTPEVSSFGKNIMRDALEYRTIIVAVEEEMGSLTLHMNHLTKSKLQAISATEKINAEVTAAAVTVAENIEQEIISTVLIVLALCLLVVLFLALATNYFFHSTITRPLKTLQTGLKSFSQGDFNTQINLDRKDEWRVVENSFNTMANDLSRTYLALSESEEKFRELAELLPQPVFELDQQGGFTFSNQRIFELFGYTPQELQSDMQIYQLVSPSDKERLQLSMQTIFNDQEFGSQEYKALRKNGTEFPVLMNYGPINRGDNIVGIRGIVVDITKRKQVEKELAEHRDHLEYLVGLRTVALAKAVSKLKLSEEHFRTLVDTIPYGVQELDNSGTITYVNKAYQEMLGITQVELIGHPVWIDSNEPAVTEARVKSSQKKLSEQNEAPAPTPEYQSKRTRSGEVIDVRIFWNYLRNSDGDITGTISVLTDITETLQAEKALQKSESLYRSLATQMNDGFLILDKDFKFTYINPSLQKLIGYSEQEMLSMKVDDFATTENRDILVRSLDRMIKTRENIRFEATFYSNERQPIALLISSRADFENEMLNGIYAICTNITRLKATELTLRENQENLEERIQERTKELEIAKNRAEHANDLKSEFLANISHELRTPMHAILSYSKFGIEKMDIKSKERIKQYFTNINISGKRLLDLLNDLLDLSRMQAEKMEFEFKYSSLELAFYDMKREMIPLLQEKNLKLTMEDKRLGSMNFDVYKIKQVISNLFSNAIKFADQDSEILVTFEDKADKVLISIHNQGVQIPPDELLTIFDPFIQSSLTKTGAGGTGLGLHICQKIINYHEGEIWAEENSQGATIKFYLPKDLSN